MNLSEQNMRCALRRAEGKTLAAIGAEFDLSSPRVHEILSHARKSVDKLELDLLAAAKTGELVAYLIPHGPDRQTGICFLHDWVLPELRKRGVEVKVEHRPTANGNVFFLEDVTSYGNEGENT